MGSLPLRTGRVSSVCHCTKKVASPSVATTIVVLLFWAYQVKCLPNPSSIESSPELSCSFVKATVAFGRGWGVLTNCFPCGCWWRRQGSTIAWSTSPSLTWGRQVIQCTATLFGRFFSISIYQMPEKLLTIIWALHEDSTATVRANGKTTEKFPITTGVYCQGCVLAPTLFNLYFNAAIQMALDEQRMAEKGIKVANLHNAFLVRNRKILKLATPVINLEYTKLYIDSLLTTTRTVNNWHFLWHPLKIPINETPLTLFY